MSHLWRSLFPTSTTELAPTTISIGNGKFPVEILEEVFSRLTCLDLFSCRLTCRLWSKTSYHSFQASIHSPLSIDNRVDGIDGYMPDLADDAIPEVQIKVNVTMRHSDNGPIHDLHIGWFSSYPARCLKGIRLNPVLENTSLEAMTRRRQTTAWSLFNVAGAKWPPQMPICNPPMSRLDILVRFYHSSDTLSEHNTILGRRAERIRRWGGLKIDDVARCVAKHVEAIKMDIQKGIVDQ